MDKVRRPASALPPPRLSFGAGKRAYKTAEIPPTGLHSWAWRVAIAALATAWVWAIGHGASRSSETDQMDIFAGPEAPLPGLLLQSRTVANNNMIARLGWEPNVDGTAIRLTALGRLLVRVIAAVFDAYLPPDAFREGASKVG